MTAGLATAGGSQATPSRSPRIIWHDHPSVTTPDLNLLFALDVLLQEGSVTAAARKLNLSAPAMSRTLGRLRKAIGDPLFVKSGRGLVPTPRAMALQGKVHEAVEGARQLLQPDEKVEPMSLRRAFNLQANDVFLSAFGEALLARVRQEAPGVVLRFAPESDAGNDVVADGKVDLFIGAAREMSPDAYAQPLFTTKFVGLARKGHPLFEQEITARRLASYDRISVSRRGRTAGPVDDALDALGLSRHVSLVVPTFQSGVFMLGSTDLILLLPEHVAQAVRRMGLDAHAFELPLSVDAVSIIQAWHPRYQNDGGHQWLRRIVHGLCSVHGRGTSTTRHPQHVHGW